MNDIFHKYINKHLAAKGFDHSRITKNVPLLHKYASGSTLETYDGIINNLTLPSINHLSQIEQSQKEHLQAFEKQLKEFELFEIQDRNFDLKSELSLRRFGYIKPYYDIPGTNLTYPSTSKRLYTE